MATKINTFQFPLISVSKDISGNVSDHLILNLVRFHTSNKPKCNIKSVRILRAVAKL